MRAWATANPAVLAVHVEIDELRYGILRDSAAAIVDDDARADRFARWAIYVLIGYEQCTLPTDITALGWIGGQLTRSLEPGSDVAITAAGRKEST
ncbi:hypothetical protein [Mycolicibacterium sp.]|uniref:hypothetical protein n=1 Tax=Mycolicibacterium sp. TaxID=2320850 RepID=UPI003D0DC961